MKILVVGLGSIGSRHLKNILSLGYTDVSYVSSRVDIRGEFSHLTGYKTLSDALQSQHFDCAILCTPTAFHTIHLKLLADFDVSMIYLEKPVSHNLKGVGSLYEQFSQNNTYVRVGFDLHFDPGLMKVRELLQDGVIGDLLFFNAFVGQYLPDWRPHEDYRKGMSAKKSSGGGVMLDLVHEIDYIRWLVGKPKEIICKYSNTGSLDIETEDVADIILMYESGVSGTIHLDYQQRKLIRNCIFTGVKGTIIWNLAESIVKVQLADSSYDFSYHDFERNDRFKSVMDSFLKKSDDQRLTTLREGIDSLQIILSAKESSERKIFKKINYSI